MGVVIIKVVRRIGSGHVRLIAIGRGRVSISMVGSVAIVDIVPIPTYKFIGP